MTTEVSVKYLRNLIDWSDIKEHLSFLKDVAKGSVVEIGVRTGVSTSALLYGVEQHGGHLYSIDMNNCPVFDGHDQWTFIQKDSIKDKDEILQLLPQEYNVLFVDGSHSYESCLSDLQTYGERASMILVHDVDCPDTFPGVKQALDDYSKSCRLSYTIRNGSYGLGVISKV